MDENVCFRATKHVRMSRIRLTCPFRHTPLAQWIEASVFYTECRWFESSRGRMTRAWVRVRAQHHCIITQGVAQPGSVPVLGTGGRWFKSSYPERACHAQALTQHAMRPRAMHKARVGWTCMRVERTPCMTPVQYLGFSSTLFLVGVWGIFLNRKNIIVMLMSIELMLLAVNLNFLVFSVWCDDLMGQLFSLFILTVAAAESAIGLALLVIYYRARGTVAVEFVNLMKG